MNKNLSQSITLFLFLCAAALSVSADQTIRQRVKMQGQTIETKVMVKGSRQRTETSMGGEAGKFMPKVATVMQCDLRRNLQINDQKRLYVIDPFAEEITDASTALNSQPVAGARTPTERGGVVTMIYTITDTGERRQMFGLTARRIRTVMSTEASPDACNKESMRIESDGWYVDLAGFSCPVSSSRMPPMPRSAGGGCQDRIRFRTSGANVKMGFPLEVTTTMFDKLGKPQMTTTTETLELSNATLDAALFDIPAGYSLARSPQDLYQFDPAEMMRQMGQNDDDDDDDTDKRAPVRSTAVGNTAPVGEKRPGAVRIGVLALTNKSDEQVSVDALRSALIRGLAGGNVEAVAVSSVEDAKSKSCDFVLYTDIAKLKQSAANKIGGMFGKVTGVEATKEKFDVQIDYRLVSTATGQAAAQNKVAQKSEGNAQQAAESVLAQAARAVSAAAGKN